MDETQALPEIHDAAQQTRNLRQILQEDKQHIGFFFGAGCPLGIREENNDKQSMNLIPAVVALTKKIAEKLQDEEKTRWGKICKECSQGDGAGEPTVEDILTELRTLTNRKGNSPILEVSKDDFKNLDQKICSLIAEEVNKLLPKHRNAYGRFASWVGGISREFPIEIFAPNYDLLFEQALEQNFIPHFDGFVGSYGPWFDLAAIEHDAIPERWVRLWKLHGSINWVIIEEEINGHHSSRVIRVARGAAEGKVMIYPSHLKYEQSRRMPYLAMLDRLRAFFHSAPAPRLIVCGYSFADEHLNEILLDGLRGNRNAQCFALMFSDLSGCPQVVEYARMQGNLTVLAKDGAVVGTRLGKYRPKTAGGEENRPWLEEMQESGASQPEKSPRSLLGDFHYFGLFLEALCGEKNNAE